MLYTLVPIVCFLPTVVSSNGHWSYKDIPAWAHANLYCKGNAQSPINIQASQSHYNHRLLPMYIVTNATGNGFHLVNNGHSAELKFQNHYALVNVAPDSEDYRVAQIHFHWGHANDDKNGSEHLLNGRSFPLEMHMVTYSSWYSNLGDAAANTRSLAVVGAFFELSNKPNPLLQPIIDGLKHIPLRNNVTVLNETVDLLALLNDDRLMRYYRYDGSLTTPPCYESVIWSVLEEPLSISLAQLHQFHALHDANGHRMVDTYRPPQPLGTRKLFRSFGHPTAKPDKTKGRKPSQGNHAPQTRITIELIAVVVGMLLFCS